MADRVAYYKAMKDMGAMTDDEIRREENMPALTDAQKEALAPPPPPQPVIDTTAVEDNPPNPPALPLRALP
jgi:hypothetical protein